MATLKQYEPKVFNDLDEIVAGREERWRSIQKRQAKWTTRGGYMENARGSREDMLARLAIVLFMIAFSAAIGVLAWVMTK